MTSNNFNASDFQPFEIESARDVVFCSFVVQKTLMPLDLSACEYMLSRRSIFTEDGYKKMCQPKRHILYKLHLDLPRNFEISLRNHAPSRSRRHRAFYCGITSVSKSIYNRDLAQFIVHNIRLSDNKTMELSRYMNVMKMLKFHENRITANFIFENIIHDLYPDCMDSNLVVEFAKTFSFYSWIFNRESPVIVGFVLEHARRIRCDIFGSSIQRLDPINACILFKTIRNISGLQEYGIAFNFENDSYMEALREILGSINTTQRIISERRIFLLLQFFYFCAFNHTSWVYLRSIWRSIPDPYLSEEEIHYAFGKVTSLEDLHAMINYYYPIIEEDHDQTIKQSPRSLLHLSRVAVRYNLSSNFQLPHGISEIGVGYKLERYLRLEL